MSQDNRIDPSIPIEDEEDGQRFFDVVASVTCLSDDERDAIEALDYTTAAMIFRAIKAA